MLREGLDWGVKRGDFVKTFEPPLREGDKVELKKQHACGEKTWTVLMAGADVRLKCTGCGRVILMDRVKFRSRVKRRLES